MTARLLIDPDLLASGTGPLGLITRFENVETVFGYFSADPYTGPNCRRCGRLLHTHVWQFLDGDGDVMDCEVRS